MIFFLPILPFIKAVKQYLSDKIKYMFYIPTSLFIVNVFMYIMNN